MSKELCRFRKHRFGPIGWLQSHLGSRVRRICLEWKGPSDKSYARARTVLLPVRGILDARMEWKNTFKVQGGIPRWMPAKSINSGICLKFGQFLVGRTWGNASADMTKQLTIEVTAGVSNFVLPHCWVLYEAYKHGYKPVQSIIVKHSIEFRFWYV